MFPKLRRITSLLSRLPGVGEKTAQRYLLHMLAGDPEVARALGEELRSLHEHVTSCERCGNLAELVPPEVRAICTICLDSRRDARLVCVVARVQDLLAIERATSMRGTYFVLGKLLSPLEGTGPDQIPTARLLARVRAEGITEVILATPPSVDGEATALLLRQELQQLEVRVTRIASGVPHGGDLEFADPITMGRALEGRNAM